MLAFEVAQSCIQTVVTCHGQGIEPFLHFDHITVDFAPTVSGYASEQEIIVCNPCDFPVEFYSIEYDHVYLEEEKVRS